MIFTEVRMSIKRRIKALDGKNTNQRIPLSLIVITYQDGTMRTDGRVITQDEIDKVKNLKAII